MMTLENELFLREQLTVQRLLAESLAYEVEFVTGDDMLDEDWWVLEETVAEKIDKFIQWIKKFVSKIVVTIKNFFSRIKAHFSKNDVVLFDYDFPKWWSAVSSAINITKSLLKAHVTGDMSNEDISNLAKPAKEAIEKANVENFAIKSGKKRVASSVVLSKVSSSEDQLKGMLVGIDKGSENLKKEATIDGNDKLITNKRGLLSVCASRVSSLISLIQNASKGVIEKEAKENERKEKEAEMTAKEKEAAKKKEEADKKAAMNDARAKRKAAERAAKEADAAEAPFKEESYIEIYGEELGLDLLYLEASGGMGININDLKGNEERAEKLLRKAYEKSRGNTKKLKSLKGTLDSKLMRYESYFEKNNIDYACNSIMQDMGSSCKTLAKSFGLGLISFGIIPSVKMIQMEKEQLPKIKQICLKYMKFIEKLSDKISEAIEKDGF